MKSIILFAAALALASCAHHRDVRPSESGKHTVIFQTDKKDQGYNNAKSQADHFCEKQNKIAYIKKEESRYTGRMNQDDYESRKTAAKVAQGVGSGVFAFGGKKESDLGGIAALGGSIANEAIGKGYTYTMQFTCK
ncbi:MAG: hypothetical protein CME64_14245 [Halobacteriovoraceae bacterium]|nr:hypothetical protein [Halobacteriovoraceae bacterium]|tara:strand:- start:51164 stop:51571 length:408 start_codon:yes stop_codon:yes gene_type:complete